MTSKHHRWQARWRIDRGSTVAVHDSGLIVRLVDGRGVADNGDEVARALAATHGEHNAAAMVLRLAREGAQMLIDPGARGWRG